MNCPECGKTMSIHQDYAGCPDCFRQVYTVSQLVDMVDRERRTVDKLQKRVDILIEHNTTTPFTGSTPKPGNISEIERAAQLMAMYPEKKKASQCPGLKESTTQNGAAGVSNTPRRAGE